MFQGFTPLTNSSEFTFTGTGTDFFGSVTVSGGQLRYDNPGAQSGYRLGVVNVSTAQTDNSFVAVNVYDQAQSSNFTIAAPAFGLGINNYVAAFVNVISAGSGNILNVQFFGAVGGMQFLQPVTTTPPYTTGAGTPWAFALGIAGTVVTGYYRPVGGVWTAFATYDLTAQGLSAATLQTWQAAVAIQTSNPGHAYINSLIWGPTSNLFGTAVPNVVGLGDAAAQSAILSLGFPLGTITTTQNAAAPGVVISQNPAAGAYVPLSTPINLGESLGLPIPDLTNTSLSMAAPAALSAAGFVLGAVTYSADVLTIAGNVLSQSPAPGTFAAGGAAVNVVVSTGRAALLVPDILYGSETDAINALIRVGLAPGAISFVSSTAYAAGTVISQNPSAGTPIAYGSLVAFTVSSGAPIQTRVFDVEATVISQYANSPILLQLINNMNQYLDQSANFANFFSFVWNVDTAQGFGLDVWGRIVQVPRLLRIPNTTPYVGFDVHRPPDWQTFADNRDPTFGGNGALYTGYNATQAYLLSDTAYRQLILAKALANIALTTIPALNQILQNLYGAGNAWVSNTGVMAIAYNFNFIPSPVQLAILQQSNVIPTPPGVAVTIVTP